MNGAWFLIFGAHFMVQGAVKDSAFLGVRLADGLKLDTTSLGLRTKVSNPESILHFVYRYVDACVCTLLMPIIWGIAA
jgi:hypothetical protein